MFFWTSDQATKMTAYTTKRCIEHTDMCEDHEERYRKALWDMLLFMLGQHKTFHNSHFCKNTCLIWAVINITDVIQYH